MRRYTIRWREVWAHSKRSSPPLREKREKEARKKRKFLAAIFSKSGSSWLYLYPNSPKVPCNQNTTDATCITRRILESWNPTNNPDKPHAHAHAHADAHAHAHAYAHACAHASKIKDHHPLKDCTIIEKKSQKKTGLNFEGVS
ncbi:hypothetical protein ACMFMG_007033 [Clarireedia jacksonii]